MDRKFQPRRNLLLDESPLFVIPSLAEAIGLNEAIFLQQINYWLVENRKAGRNYKDGRWWTYNTYEEWHKTFPFWSVSTIKRIIRSLEDRGLLIHDSLSDNAWNRTNWYSIDYEKYEALVQCIGSEWPNGEVQDEPIDESIQAQSLTEITPENNKQTSSREFSLIEEPLYEFVMECCNRKEELLTRKSRRELAEMCSRLRSMYPDETDQRIGQRIAGFGRWWRNKANHMGEHFSAPTPSVVLSHWQNFADYCKSQLGGGLPPVENAA